MEINTEKCDGVLVARPMAKRIDSASAAAFKGAMVDLINAGNLVIVLDLAEVDFIDSTGLGMLVSILKSLGREGRLLVCRPSPNVDSLFGITRMNKLFDIFPSVEEALDRAGGASANGASGAR